MLSPELGSRMGDCRVLQVKIFGSGDGGRGEAVAPIWPAIITGEIEATSKPVALQSRQPGSKSGLICCVRSKGNGMNGKRLLIVAHAPSPNTERLRDALVAGARSPEIQGVEITALSPFATTPNEVLSADAIILGTTENLGYMSGALKDFFDRCYYPCLERTEGLPYALYIRAGNDGAGAKRSIETIVTGLRWRRIQEPLICRGAWQEDFIAKCGELGTLIVTGLDVGVF